jgi:ATP-dependent Clp protease protease subunit
MIEGQDRIGKYVALSEDSKRFYYTDDPDVRNEAVGKAYNSKKKRAGATNTLTELNNERNIYVFDRPEEWTSAFEPSEAAAFLNAVLELDAESNEPINVFINSNGGYVQALYTMVSAIKGVKSKIRTICLGNAMSCGAVLLASGDERYAGKASAVMIHDVSSLTYGSLSEIKEQVEELDRMNGELIAMMAEKSEQHPSVLKELMTSDFYMNASEALELGLVDGVLAVEDVLDNMTDWLKNHPGIINGRILGGKMIERMKNAPKPQKKGEPDMDKDQMVAEFKAKHGIDILDLQNKLKMTEEHLQEAETALKEAEEKAATAEEAVKELEEKKEADAIENILTQLIRDCKSTQVYNDEVLRPLFKQIGSKAASEKAGKLPKMVHTETEANTKETGEEPKVDEVVAKVEDYMKKHEVASYELAYVRMQKEGLI